MFLHGLSIGDFYYYYSATPSTKSEAKEATMAPSLNAAVGLGHAMGAKGQKRAWLPSIRTPSTKSEAKEATKAPSSNAAFGLGHAKGSMGRKRAWLPSIRVCRTGAM